MSWWQFSLQCKASQLEQVEELLTALGTISISIADAGDEPIFEPLPEENPMWSESIVTATFAGSTDPESLYNQLAAGLPPGIGHSLRRQQLEDRDWETAYKQHFHPLECAPGLWIVPSWCEPPEADATVIRLDPGLAFGTGGHPTTALCLHWLGSHDIADQCVIDYGCGSGILGIAALKLGAARLLAVDIDPQALTASRANLSLNRLDPDRFDLSAPDSMAEPKADLLVANILAGPLQELAPRFSELLVDCGRILLSGILKTQLEDIQLAYRPYFDLDPPQYRDEWVSISGQRN